MRGRSLLTLTLLVLLGSVLGSVLTLVVARYAAGSQGPGYDSISERQGNWFKGLEQITGSPQASGLNFVRAAALSRPTVVNIQVRYGAGSSLMGGFREDGYYPDDEQQRQPSLRDFFGYPEEPSQGDQGAEASGSGVIVSDDGYIVTNNHVIAKATEITVLLNDRRRYKGKVVGADPSTDLALVKIEAKNLAFARYGNSDSLQIGEWVLAVGNPFELQSTVTAGIVSAKARNINILQSGSSSGNMAVESFIQTDAAVNPGNSGGALVNLRGDLIGINTAIASNTGSYTGYSFAVPVTLVKKVMDDLLKYGEVQRAMLGVSIRDVDSELAEAKNIPDTRGVYVAGVMDKGAAGRAGVKEGDVILRIDGVEVNSVSALQEYVARYRPGDKVKVMLERGRDMRETVVTLRNALGQDKISKSKGRTTIQIDELRASFRQPSNEVLSELGISSGVEVVEIERTSPLYEAHVRPGFVITQLDKRPVTGPEELKRRILQSQGGVLLEGVYPDGRRAYYGVRPLEN